VIVAQGAEAGGHGLARATFTLVPEIAGRIYRAHRRRQYSSLPVASVTGAGSRLLVMLGRPMACWSAHASGHSTEALVPPSLQKSSSRRRRGFDDPHHRRRTSRAGSTGRSRSPRAVLKTRFTMDWHGREAALAEPATLEREEARLLECP